MNTDPNMSEQSGQTEQSGSEKQSTTVEKNEKKNNYKTPIQSDRETDLTKTNPRMWWEQISEYIDLTYHRNIEDMTDHGIEGMDAHTSYNKKGDVIWDLSPKAKHEIMRSQWSRQLKNVNLPELLSTILQCKARRRRNTRRILEKIIGCREK